MPFSVHDDDPTVARLAGRLLAVMPEESTIDRDEHARFVARDVVARNRRLLADLPFDLLLRAAGRRLSGREEDLPGGS